MNESLKRYRQKVHGAADYVEDVTAEPDPMPMSDAIYEACDGYPISHSQILDVLRHCDAEIGSTPSERWEASTDAWKVLHVIAADCYRRDVREEIGKRDEGGGV